MFGKFIVDPDKKNEKIVIGARIITPVMQGIRTTLFTPAALAWLAYSVYYAFYVIPDYIARYIGKIAYVTTLMEIVAFLAFLIIPAVVVYKILGFMFGNYVTVEFTRNLIRVRKPWSIRWIELSRWKRHYFTDQRPEFVQGTYIVDLINKVGTNWLDSLEIVLDHRDEYVRIVQIYGLSDAYTFRQLLRDADDHMPEFLRQIDAARRPFGGDIG